MMTVYEVALRTLCPYGFVFGVEYDDHDECNCSGCSPRCYKRCRKTAKRTNATMKKQPQVIVVKDRSIVDFTPQQIQQMNRELCKRIQK